MQRLTGSRACTTVRACLIVCSLAIVAFLLFQNSSQAAPIRIVSQSPDSTVAQTATITGRMTDSSGNPIVNGLAYALRSNGSDVTDNYTSVWTDANGYYTLANIPVTTNLLYFTKAFSVSVYTGGFTDYTLSPLFTLTVDEVKTVDIVMETGSNIAGKVTGTGNAPLEGIEVRVCYSVVRDYCHQGGQETTTDANGDYARGDIFDAGSGLTFPAPGRWRLHP